MWICLNTGFISIVQDPRDDKLVWVRGRRPGDVEAFVGPNYRIIEMPKRDYRFRACVTKFELSKMLAQCADKISYTNFKNSVPLEDSILYSFYTEIWHKSIEYLDPTWSERHK
jgi:hypothetical protein